MLCFGAWSFIRTVSDDDSNNIDLGFANVVWYQVERMFFKKYRKRMKKALKKNRAFGIYYCLSFALLIQAVSLIEEDENLAQYGMAVESKLRGLIKSNSVTFGTDYVT